MFVIKAKPIFNSFNINNKTLNLGTFAKIEDAIEARKSAEVKYFGEFRFDMSNKDIINEANLEDHLTWIIHGVAVKVAESHIVTVF